jgi:hypothetical protein
MKKIRELFVKNLFLNAFKETIPEDPFNMHPESYHRILIIISNDKKHSI